MCEREVPVLALDGPSGSGKGTIARRVAVALGWHLLDSGALYRLVGLAADREGLDLADEGAVAALAAGLAVEFGVDDAGNERIRLGGDDVTLDVRTEETGRLASTVAALPAVRAALMDLQKSFRQAPGLVADGRDLGTQVFPNAAVKVFLTATPVRLVGTSVTVPTDWVWPQSAATRPPSLVPQYSHTAVCAVPVDVSSAVTYALLNATLVAPLEISMTGLPSIAP